MPADVLAHHLDVPVAGRDDGAVLVIEVEVAAAGEVGEHVETDRSGRQGVRRDLLQGRRVEQLERRSGVAPTQTVSSRPRRSKVRLAALGHLQRGRDGGVHARADRDPGRCRSCRRRCGCCCRDRAPGTGAGAATAPSPGSASPGCRRRPGREAAAGRRGSARPPPTRHSRAREPWPQGRRDEELARLSNDGPAIGSRGDCGPSASHQLAATRSARSRVTSAHGLHRNQRGARTGGAAGPRPRFGRRRPPPARCSSPRRRRRRSQSRRRR